MSLAAQLNQTTVLTPQERERSKTAQQRAEDIIYTLNHTLTCLLATDLFIVPVLRGFGMNIGHTHGHHDHKHHHHEAAKPPLGQRIQGEIKHALGHFNVRNFSWRGAGNWFAGEFIGDVGAAAVTIPIQRFFPGFMDGIRRSVEPFVGGFFHRGAERSAHKWADKHGLAYDSQEVVDHAQKLYEYEMRHLPQMGVWTISSILLHGGVMKVLEPKITLGEFGRQKAAGALITAGLVVGARAMSPANAHKWDEKVGKHVIVPVTKKVGKLFGIEERDVDDYHARQTKDSQPQSWANRVREPALAPEVARNA